MEHLNTVLYIYLISSAFVENFVKFSYNGISISVWHVFQTDELVMSLQLVVHPTASSETFLTSVASWHIFEEKSTFWMFSATSWRTLRAIICIISFWIVLCTYLLIFFLCPPCLKSFVVFFPENVKLGKIEIFSTSMTCQRKSLSHWKFYIRNDFQQILSIYLASLNVVKNWAEILP